MCSNDSMFKANKKLDIKLKEALVIKNFNLNRRSEWGMNQYK